MQNDVEIRCRTNLDLNGEGWPERLPTVPRVGDVIESSTSWFGTRLRLKVCGVTWKYREGQQGIIRPGWYAEIELHMEANFRCVSHFEAWYRRIQQKMDLEYYQALCQEHGW